VTPILVPTLDELAFEFERAYAAERAANALCVASSEGAAEGFAYDDACGVLGEVCRQIAGLPAQTTAHVQLKARALAWHAFPDGEEPATIDERLAFQLVRALVDGLPGGAA
jgi:hypothetical protein